MWYNNPVMSIQERLRNKSLQEDGVVSPFVKMRTMMAQMLKDIFDSFRLEVKAEIQKEVREAKRNLTANILNAVDIAKVKGELTPKKGVDYVDGKNGIDVDEKIIVKKVLRQIAKPRDGKDADVDLIIGEVIRRIPASKIMPLDTPKQIVEKVNDNKGVLIESIENLPEELEAIKRRIVKESAKGGGSGGMGKPMHEQFSGNGVITSFTLSYNVAANGTAVFGCRYQGQTLYLGDQFTISGKTLAMVGFIPDDGTKIEITYLRT